MKYFWGQSIRIIKAKQQTLEVFRTRLASLDTDGLNVPKINADYMCQYSGSLIGKHFKTVAQIMEFAAHGLIPDSVLKAWRIIGALVVLLWHTKIDNIETYTVSSVPLERSRAEADMSYMEAELSRTIEDFLNVTAECSPSILISKPKFHFLVHLPFFIRRFGIALIFSTERYESFNSVFRSTCILSNRQAPSLDSCEQFADFDVMKHVATGGSWYHAATKRWVHAGPDVIQRVKKRKELSKLLGWTSDQVKSPGMPVSPAM